MNADAERVAARLTEAADVAVRTRHPAEAVLRAWLRRLRPRTHWVPAGGSSPLGALGHVNAALELAEQVRRGHRPAPARLVVPFGTGGTAAGLALGLALAGLEATVVAVGLLLPAVVRPPPVGPPG